MRTRSATAADLPAVIAAQVRWNTHWFGAPEDDEDELAEDFGRVASPQRYSQVVLDESGRLLAAAWCWSPTESAVVVDPAADLPRVHDVLLPWLRSVGVRTVEALDRDQPLRRSLERHGWEHDRSSFELSREVAAGPRLARPDWPDDVRLTVMRPGDEPVAHDAVYRGAGWADVPGHHARDYQEWRGLFLGEGVPPDQHLLAWRGDRLVGLVIGRIFSGRIAWVCQLAVVRDQRRAGLGRALLLESFGRRSAAGATHLGLGVDTDNAKALQLYLDVGLVVEREWMQHRPVR
jgi:mycothiol synthase